MLLASKRVTLAERFCYSFRDKLTWLISRAAERCRSESGTSLLRPRVVEVVQHLTMCRDRSHEFKGRDDVLRLIRDYVRPSLQQQQQQTERRDVQTTWEQRAAPCRNKPLVLCGESGSGKTSVVAKVSSTVTYRRTNGECRGFPGTAIFSIREIADWLCLSVISLLILALLTM